MLTFKNLKLRKKHSFYYYFYQRQSLLVKYALVFVLLELATQTLLMVTHGMFQTGNFAHRIHLQTPKWVMP